MPNTISRRLYDFLKDHPPFSFMQRGDLMDLADNVLVVYFESEEEVYRQDSPTADHFYVVCNGAVELLEENGPDVRLTDICDEGDVFGLETLAEGGAPYCTTALVRHEALVYSIPVDMFRERTETNPQVNHFVESASHLGFRGVAPGRSWFRPAEPGDGMAGVEAGLSQGQALAPRVTPIVCSCDSTIRSAAQLMKENGVGSIVVIDSSGKPGGIITDRDLRNKVVAGGVAADACVASIMSSPVVTEMSDQSAAALQATMIAHNIHHLCITEDGTDQTRLTGVVSDHDIFVANASNPSVLIREAKRAPTADALAMVRTKTDQLLRNYLQREVPIAFIGRMVGEINDTMTVRAIQLAKEALAAGGLEQPDVRWCWLETGSRGRREQLLKTDLDNAIVFDDGDPDRIEATRAYFVELASAATAILVASGFSPCPSDMMAQNPRWCLSLKEWLAQFYEWIFTPTPMDIMLSTIFFDFRPVAGSHELAEAMTRYIEDAVSQQNSFLSALARHALQNPPPLSFFRNILLEHDGEHKDKFDIKARAMMPLTDGARALALASRLTGTSNTIQRFRGMAKLEPKNSELFELLSDVYELLIRFRTEQGLRHGSSGRFFAPAELNKMQRIMLKNSFSPIKELQSLLSVRFNLNVFGR